MSTDGLLTGTVQSETVDPDALVAALFAEHAPSLVRLAGLFCDDRNAAEDLVQEAFIRLHRSAHTIKDPAKAPAYLRSILMNLARDHNRRGLVSLRHRSTMGEPQVAPGFEDAAIASGEDRAVLAAVRLLPDRQRACLVLHYYMELSESETAATLGISKSSVKTHCRRALTALESTLEGQR